MPNNRGGGKGGFYPRGRGRGGGGDANRGRGVNKKNRGGGGGGGHASGGGGVPAGGPPRQRQDIWADVEKMKTITIAPDTKVQIQRLWNMLDVDGDGFLTLADFQHILTRASLSPSVAQSKAVVVFMTLQQELDFNRDDKITPHEFALGLVNVAVKVRGGPCICHSDRVASAHACLSRLRLRTGASGHSAPHAAVASRLDHVPADADRAGGQQQPQGVLQEDLQCGQQCVAGLLRGDLQGYSRSTPCYREVLPAVKLCLRAVKLSCDQRRSGAGAQRSS